MSSLGIPPVSALPLALSLLSLLRFLSLPIDLRVCEMNIGMNVWRKKKKLGATVRSGVFACYFLSLRRCLAHRNVT